MTFALSPEAWADEPPQCLPGVTAVCKDGYAIPCETRYGVEACLTYFGCVENENFSCDIPPEVPLAGSGLFLASLVLLIILWRITS